MGNLRATGETLLRQIAMADISTVAVMSRFGLNPGYGNKSVGEACADRGIDRNLFLWVINEYVGVADADNRISYALPELETTLRFLEDTDNYYEQVQFPNIMRHLKHISTRPSPLDRYLIQLGNKFSERGKFDREVLFNSLRDSGGIATENLSGVTEAVIAEAHARDIDIEEELSDLMEFFIVHVERDLDSNMLMGVITAIESLRKDVSGINRIRKSLIDGHVPSYRNNEKDNGGNKEALTQREKEVLSLLAEGLSNKEVAARLCISANTAITHRRNIVAKLGIRSLAGLSLYAFTHGLTEGNIM